jgi:hypothetical protein
MHLIINDQLEASGVFWSSNENVRKWLTPSVAGIRPAGKLLRDKLPFQPMEHNG